MRVQDLPDELTIDAARTTAIRQIGNAVPPLIGEVFGRAIADAIALPSEGIRDDDATAELRVAA
jgi:site-specific DNA-cytosine methylase